MARQDVRPGLSIPISVKKFFRSSSSLISKSLNGSPGPASLGLQNNLSYVFFQHAIEDFSHLIPA